MIKVKEYAKREYWEVRYNAETHFEWLQNFATLKEELLKTITQFYGEDKSIKILHIGCGNSTLGVSLYEEGYENIYNVDYSEVVINNMRGKYSPTHPKMQWLQMDCRNMNFEDNSFDLVIDKATLDAISCGGAEEVNKVALEVHRILKPTLWFLLITFSRFRIEDFIDEEIVDRDSGTADDARWTVTRSNLQGPEEDDNGSVSLPSNMHYLYMLRKK